MTAGVRQTKRALARERILGAAARAIREDGPEAVSVARVMKDAGLTHGAFYAYFASKGELVAAAMQVACERFLGELEASVGDVPAEDRPGHIAAAYLSLKHRADPGKGCLMAALGPELARANGSVTEAYERGVRETMALIERVLCDALGPAPERSDQAAADLATVVGGMVLARAMREEGEAERILNACRAELAARAMARAGGGDGRRE